MYIVVENQVCWHDVIITKSIISVVSNIFYFIRNCKSYWIFWWLSL